ncbi:MAG: GldG family protein [Anaerolineales bacterium]|nr:GldG family protein [Anaerolineales bacterium]
MSLAFLGIVGVLNYISFNNPQRWDLTKIRQFTLAQETIDTLERLPQPVTALAFFTPQTSPAAAEGLLDQYRFSSKGNFDFRFIDPYEDPLTASQANVTRDGTVILRMGEFQEQVTIVNEPEMTAALIRLINPREIPIYFLSGHGEFSPDEVGDFTYQQVRTALEAKNYRVENLNLLALNIIPEDAEVILIAGPTQPLSTTEVNLLQEFLEHGGALISLSEPLPVTDFGDSPDPLASYLLDEWGIALGKDMVVDLTSNQPFVAYAYQYGDHLITEKLERVVTLFPTARSVTLAEQIPGILADELVFTSPQSWAETNLEALMSTGEDDEQSQIGPDEGEDIVGMVPLAVAAENSFNGSRVVVIGDSEFASNAFFTQYGNGDFLLNAIDWASEQEDLISLTPKENIVRMMVPPQTITLNLILFGSVFLLPGIVLLSGVFVWIQRRRRG